jgi:hypothetical protein
MKCSVGLVKELGLSRHARWKRGGAAARGVRQRRSNWFLLGPVVLRAESYQSFVLECVVIEMHAQNS